MLEFNRCLALVTKLSNCPNSPKTSKDASQIFAKITSFIGGVPIKLGVCNDKNRKKILERNKTCKVKTSHLARVKSFNDAQVSFSLVIVVS